MIKGLSERISYTYSHTSTEFFLLEKTYDNLPEP